jgi:hypothetical protein
VNAYARAIARAMTNARAADAERRRDALDRVVALYVAWDKPAEAATWRLKRMDADVPANPFAPLARPSCRAASVAYSGARIY